MYRGADTMIETQTNVIEAAFQDYTERKDIAILLINQHVSHGFIGGRLWPRRECKLMVDC
jgi:V-type H+-transporting ATPase subunit F